MAKDKSELSKDERRALKAAKKAAKASGSKPEGITKATERKDKSDKKEKTTLAERALKEIQNPVSAVKNEDDGEDDDDEGGAGGGEDTGAVKETKSRPVGALVPFANPLADAKVAKKVFRGVKKAAVHRTLKRGVKEVVKALRKSPADSSSLSSNTPPLPHGIVVLAADISPMDVISHLPVLCEDHGIPYIYVASRAELGLAGQTKRPTSVVLMGREAGRSRPKEKDGKSDEGEKEKEKEREEEWRETYEGLVTVVQREGGRVKV